MWNKKIIISLVLNSSGLFILIFFQYMIFEFLPSVNPNIPQSEQKNAAMQLIVSKAVVLGLETIIGLSILFFLNKRLLRSVKKASVCILFDLSILLISFFYFFKDYLDKFS